MKNDSTTPVTDDDELAKVLDGMNGTNDGAALPTPSTDTNGGLQFEETTAPVADTPVAPPAPEVPETPTAPIAEPEFEVPTISADASSAGSALDDIKKDALSELRPLVDKLDLPADEKFDTLLLIIRSTDDQSLVGAAHDAAKSIEDDAKRAQALLDVIKEIDYFANQSK
jgi:hypothetical protein